MRVNGKKKIAAFMKKHPTSRSSLKTWTRLAERAHWEKPSDIQLEFPTASFLSKNCVIFNISGNYFRLMVIAIYVQEMLIVTWIGTQAEYDKINF